jgi:hypothetical protein
MPNTNTIKLPDPYDERQVHAFLDELLPIIADIHNKADLELYGRLDERTITGLADVFRNRRPLAWIEATGEDPTDPGAHIDAK